MLTISESKIKQYKKLKCLVYTKQPIAEGVECFTSNKDFNGQPYYIKTVNICNIKHSNGKFYYTNEDVSVYDDFFGKHMLPVIGAFASDNDKSGNYGSTAKSKKHKLSHSFITDISGLPAFAIGATNEDAKISEYRLYITLFNEYSIKQCQYERHNLFDAKYIASKYELESKLQNSDFLKSKDFAVINVRRKDEESVVIGLIVREPDSDDAYSYEYGRVLVDMNNKVSIKWH